MHHKKTTSKKIKKQCRLFTRGGLCPAPLIHLSNYPQNDLAPLLVYLTFIEIITPLYVSLQCSKQLPRAACVGVICNTECRCPF